MDHLSGLAGCDREPIHIPGAIQPHGVLLAVDPDRLTVRQVAGDVAALFGQPAGRVLGLPLASLGEDVAGHAAAFVASKAASNYLGTIQVPDGGRVDLCAHRSGGHLLLEFEPGPLERASGPQSLAIVEEAARSLERARDQRDLFRQASIVFRRITGFDRVMVYRFLEDGAGSVVAEDKAEDQHSFLNHRFPASDIPRQARDLYVRNLIRVIPDIGYRPAPLLADADAAGQAPLDLSDCQLRSVSPIHLQYLKNMGIAASASVSIIKDGMLWGLIACHHAVPRTLPFEVRAMCRVLSRVLAQQLAAQEETENHRQRVRLRAMEDELLSLVARANGIEQGLERQGEELLQLANAHGVAVCHRNGVTAHGHCPGLPEISAIRDWLLGQELVLPFATETLGSAFAPAKAFPASAAGLLSVVLSRQEPLAILWFRAEEPEVVNWAGNPHKPVDTISGQLTPRASFDLWQETVRGRARAWSLAEIETAVRLRTRLVELRQSKQLVLLNAQMRDTLVEKEGLLAQKDILLREVNHRVQNSLQLVSSFLSLQMRGAENPVVLAQLEEARRRLLAVALVHRRLYQSDQVQSVEMGRYVEELHRELVDSLGPEWNGHVQVRADSIFVPTDQAVSLGLIMTELVVNAAKYAYRGAAGPIDIQLKELMGRAIALTVADQGVGQASVTGTGFGEKMIKVLCAQWRGWVDHQDNEPGRRTTVTVYAA
jgi:chemotaxis family two-component system sensor kinase Cph1